MQRRCYLSSIYVLLFVLSIFFQIQCQSVDEHDDLIQSYFTSHLLKYHGHRHTRDCQHILFGNVTKSKHNAHGYGSSNIIHPIAETHHAIKSIGQFIKRDTQIHFTAINNPMRTISVLEPGYKGGCEDQTRSTVRKSAERKNCLLAINAGFFNTHTGSCLGNVISDGKLVLDSNGVQNAHFGITKDGHLFFGYLSEIDLIAEQFQQLVGGVIWLVRDGKNYITESIKIECQDTQETGTLERFAGVMSARTVVGSDKDGRVLIMQVDGKTDHNGMSLYEMADVLVEYGFVNAINLDGGGSATYVVNGTLVNYPTDKCSDNEKFNCARKVSTILCVHEVECTPLDCSGHGTCKDGKCLCNTNWGGSACDHLSCQNHCSHHGTCTNDGCTCEAGWMGDNCNTSCSQGYYGKNCVQQCSCSHGSTGTCDAVNGKCDCQPGFTGQLCENECPVGFYGNHCSSVCLCTDGCPCHPVTGSCNFTDLDQHYMQAGICYAKQQIQRQHLVPDKSVEFRKITISLICISTFAGVSVIVNIVLLCKLFTTKKKVKHGKKKRERTKYSLEHKSENEMSSFSDYPMVTTSFSKEAKQTGIGVGVGVNPNSD
ncbi:NAGPA [Mytilus coruscus]|uniref:NAGPA n=1 Tax=Mytilus coruscus TaxID=42192 RepID=A0A6J8AYY6_MYTCO|nr:NAGPA [Mytilus coruscus]